jgi:hypothetical protein
MRVGHHFLHDFSKGVFESVRRSYSMSARLVLFKIQYIIAICVADVPPSSESIIVKASD